ncbi:MAG: acylphosphatase [Spartobacteria bacterium]|nr:acylphosphatase [Spartobacteria bacterium]
MAVRFEGHVQGVGFRFTTVRLATGREVTGYVKNEFDGDVTLQAEGTREQLNALLIDIRQSAVGRYVTNEQVTWRPATGEFDTFGVKC